MLGPSRPVVGRLPRDPLDPVVRVGAALLAFYVLLLAAWALCGVLGATPRPGVPRVDFAEFWGTGRLAARGRGALAYTWPRLEAELSGAFHGPVGAPLPFYYPPPVLSALAALGQLSYGVAFAVWGGLGVAAYAAMAAATAPRPAAALVVLAAPGFLCCVFVGQNGLLTAAALGAGLLALERRPALAGCMLALLLCKPQLAVLVPLALAADRRWRALGAMALTGAGLAAASVATSGTEPWRAFAAAAVAKGGNFAGAGAIAWTRVQSVYGWLRSAGAPAGLALGAHAVAAAGFAGATLAAWRRRVTPFDVKAAMLACAMLLLTPYTFFYDAPLLGVAAGFLLRDVARRRAIGVGQSAAAAASWLLPLAWYAHNDLAVGPACAALLFGVAARRAWGYGKRTTRDAGVAVAA